MLNYAQVYLVNVNRHINSKNSFYWLRCRNYFTMAKVKKLILVV